MYVKALLLFLVCSGITLLCFYITPETNQTNKSKEDRKSEQPNQSGINRIPLALDATWLIFVDAEPPVSFATIPELLRDSERNAVIAQTAQLSENTINLATRVGKLRENTTAVLFNQFKCEKSGVMRLGVSADWFMEVYINGIKIYDTTKWGSGNGSHAFTPNDHVFDIPVNKGTNILGVKVLSGRDGWRFVCGTPDVSTIKYEVNAEWRAVDLSDLQIKPGSALDLSNLTAIPLQESTQRLPRLIIGSHGRLAAESTPGTPVRLVGGTMGLRLSEPTDRLKNTINEICRLARLQGYNLFRYFGADEISPTSDRKIEASELDKCDYLLSQMGKHGIYLYLNIFSYHLFLNHPANMFSSEVFKNRNDYKARMYLADAELRQTWQYAVEALMSHVNPYTGLAWKDDPVIACIEFYNEQEAGILWSRFTPQTQAKFDERFRHWLKQKYQTPEALANAWSDATLTDFEQVIAPNMLTKSDTVRERDFVLLCNELSAENIRWCELTLRATGYKGLTAQYNIPGWWGNLQAKYSSSNVSLVNTYFNHPSMQAEPGSKCKQNSSVGDNAHYWRYAAAARFADRPLFVTEFNHSFWNSYQHECGLLFAAYSALQNFDALIIHANAVMPKLWGPNDVFSVGSSPVARAGEFLSACLFLRRDVQPSPHRIDLEVPPSSLSDFRAVSTEQSKIALLSGFSISFPGAERPQGVPPAVRPNLVLSPSGGAKIVASTGWSSDIASTNDGGFSLTAFVKHMREQAILPTANLTDPVKGIFQSDTGEVVMRSKENLLKVATSRTEAITMENGKPETVGLLRVGNTSVPALIAACSMDGRQLANSKRIVLLYSTDTVNSGMEVSSDRVTLLNLGKLPILMRIGKLNATLKNMNATKLSLYALGFDGSRKQVLPLKSEGDLLYLNIDTGNLPNGPTSFFELAVE